MATPVVPAVPALNRHNFPEDFVFGAAGSAFQYEGAQFVDGRGASIWDTFITEQDLLGGAEFVAIEHYYRYKEDVRILKQMGFDAFRFSISWTRVLPSGTRSGGVNEAGIEFYNNLINELLANDIEPYVTLKHFDPPQGIEDEYLGFLNRQIVDDFCDYADLCFERFGDRVKHWITINEPWSFCYAGYTLGTFAPGRTSISQEQVTGRSLIDLQRFFPASPYSSAEAFARRSRRIPRTGLVGDSGTEPYTVGHHILLAHAKTVALYREKYQASQMGEIGICLVSIWMEPYSDTQSDIDAAKRAHDFQFGWFMEPLTSGDYPESMRTIVGSRLPTFSAQESELVKDAGDFVGFNYYTANYVKDSPNIGGDNPTYVTDPAVEYTYERDGVLIGEQAGSDWLHIYPQGLEKMLGLLKTKYNDPVLYIFENGCDETNNPELSLWEALYDHQRITYHTGHLTYIKNAIDELGVKLKGYFAWSLLDNFEWASAFEDRFGINYVDYERNLDRYPKLSAGWFRFFLQKETTAETLST